MTQNPQAMPDAQGFFGPYGGQLVPPELKRCMDEIAAAYEEIVKRQDFQDELAALFADYVGRPSPIFHARRLSDQLGGAQIHLKREDLNHTGAHKINHCLGEALLAKFMGKKKSLPRPVPASMAWPWPRPARWWAFPARFTWARWISRRSTPTSPRCASWAAIWCPSRVAQPR